MKIISNIPQAAKAIYALKWFSRNDKAIKAARAKGDFEEERKWILKSTSDWGKNLCRLLGITYEVEGYENIPDEGPVVFMGNHQGYADILVLCAVLDKFQFGFVAKEELGKIPKYGDAILGIRSVLMNRGDARDSVKSILEGIQYIKDGFSLCIFPEGTRSKGGPMIEFHKGSFKLATKPQVPIIPITINGSYKVFEESGVIRPANIRITIHPAVPTAGLSREEQNRLSEKVEAIVRSALEE